MPTWLKTGIWVGAAVLAALAVGALVVFLLRRWKKPPYVRAALFTEHEAAFYRELRRFAGRYGLTLFAKVRMADLLAVAEGCKNYQAWFNKISQKHADFVLCDESRLEVLAVVELDDRTHERPDRMERDRFVNEAYAAAGIPIVHIHEQRGKALEQALLAVPPLRGRRAARK